MGKTTLTWEYDSLVGEGFKIYRADSPMDPENLPLPIATAEIEDREYTDETVIDDETYYYRIASYIGGTERLSEEIEHIAENDSDPHWDKVVTLLHFDGNLNNEKGAAWSIFGAGIIDTTNPIFGAGSLSNAHNRGGAVSPTIERIDTNDSWTIEGFVYCTDRTPLNFIYSSRQAGANRNVSTLYFGDGSPLSFQIFNSAGALQQFISSAPLMPLNVATHFAVCFDKPTNTLRIFQSGQKVLEETVTVFWTKTHLACLGYYPHTDQPTRYLRGRLDEWRETVGVARYTENFTPPTEPFPNF